jgi:hypothetical protein
MSNSDNEKHSPLFSIFKEIAIEFIGVFLGNLTTKIGANMLLFVIGMVFLFSPISGQKDKPLIFYIIGGILILISIYLFSRRWKEIKNKK